MDPEKTQKLSQLFTHQIDQEHLHPAAQLVVVRHGKVVLDLAYGTGRRSKPIIPETPFFTFSVTKAFTGICVHRLIENDQIEMDAPIADYWPEFAQKGKADATIRHVFLHQAGIPAPKLNQQMLVWPWWPLVTRHVAQTTAVYPPGEKIAYHVVNYGFILGEVIRRVTGKNIDDYLQEQFLDPLGLKNTWMRIPASELSRSPRLYSGSKTHDAAVFIFNRRLFRRALIPAANLHSTARDLAVFYQMLLNDGIYNGHRFLGKETIANAIRPGAEGMDHLLKHPMRYAYGFHLQQSLSHPDGTTTKDMGSGASQQAFGHYGMASCMAFADPEADLVFTFTCNRLIDNAGKRNAALLSALWEAVL